MTNSLQNLGAPPSIFNNVIGPVMRGPSASHCAGSLRIAKLARDLMDGNIKEVSVFFHPHGSLATTHKSQGSDLGLCAGFLGWELTDERLPCAEEVIKQQNIQVNIEVKEFKAIHPNTYKINLKNENEEHVIIALSTGGGMIEILELDEVKLNVFGDYFETLIFTQNPDDVCQYVEDNYDTDFIFIKKDLKNPFVQIKTHNLLPENLIDNLKKNIDFESLKVLNPVLPILSRKNIELPFNNFSEMCVYNSDRSLPLWKLAVEYERFRSNVCEDEILENMTVIIDILKDSIKVGLKGTDYKDRILGFQSGRFNENMTSNSLLDGGVLNKIVLYVIALMETKSSMGIIVAAPTAGSCAGLPGACIALGEALGLSSKEIAKGMLAAGLIGIFILNDSTFAAEVAGCQAECGAGSGMAAAALVDLAGGSTEQATAAASMALQNTLGMICDPVANRVEVPCLGKNVMAASNAFSCANMALSGFDQVIPLNEVIQTMDAVGKSIPRELRCTALGGLSITKTSKKIEKKLNACLIIN